MLHAVCPLCRNVQTTCKQSEQGSTLFATVRELSNGWRGLYPGCQSAGIAARLNQCWARNLLPNGVMIAANVLVVLQG